MVEGETAPMDFTYGIKKVMETFEQMIGVSVQSRKGELREEYMRSCCGGPMRESSRS